MEYKYEKKSTMDSVILGIAAFLILWWVVGIPYLEFLGAL
jgi:hypothetical protein